MSKDISVKNKKILAIDFGSHSIKFIVSKQTKGVLMISKTLSIPIAPDIYNNGEILNVKELGAILQNTILNNGFKKIPIVCTVGGPNCVLRVLNLPAVKSNEQIEMITYEIQQYLPVDATQYIIQYAILEGPKNHTSGNSVILAGAIPRQFAEAIYGTFEGINIHPFALDLQVHGFSKLVETYTKQPAKSHLRTDTVIFVDLGHSQMDISLYEEGCFYMNRRVQSCGFQLDQKISRAFDLSIQDARLEKQQAGDIGIIYSEYTNENRVQNVIQSAVDEWIKEVSRIVKFYESRSSKKSVSRVYLYGGSSQFKGLAAYFEKELGITTECMRDCDTAVFDGAKRDSMAIYFNALGALIRKEE